MIRVDYTQLDPKPVRLTLHRSDGGYYSVTDQNGRLFTPPSENVGFHLRFMAAMESRQDALLDEASVEAFGHSVRVPSSGEVCGPADGNGPASPDSTRRLKLVV